MSDPRLLHWGLPQAPPPKHPYRDSFIVYGVLAVLIVVISWATGGGVQRGVVVAVLFYVAAIGWSIHRWRARLREEAAKADGRESP